MRRRYFARNAIFSRDGRMCASCVIVCAGPRRDPTCTNTASGASASANRITSSGIVAENSIVWRVLGRRHRFGDLADVGPEAHVHHAVGFVEHEDLELREVADVAAHVIEQPAGRGDDDVDAGLEGDVPAAPSARRRRPRRWRRARDTRSPGSRRRSAWRARASARGSARASRGATCAARPSRSSRIRRESTGSTYAAVLPVPVSAQPMTSRPASAYGSTAL